MSDISFSKLTWENLPARTTALSATNLNRIENGIADSVNGVNSNSHSIAELQTRISQMSGGVPPTASSTSGMNPEVSPIYVNTTDGNWYYYNGSAWQIGGQYGGAVTDTTLAISGAPADSKAVGDALAELEEAISDVTAPTDEQVANAVSDWLDDHPSAVSDGVVLHVSGSGTYRTVDKTYSEILFALSAGKTVVVNDLDAIYPYVGQMSQNGVASLAFGVSAVYQQNVVLDGYLIAQVSGSTVAVRTQEYSNFYSKSEIDTMIGNIETLLSAI
jgi:hypothetical protein